MVSIHTSPIVYTGDIKNNVCPISFIPVKDLEHPVGFDTEHAFECECIVRWLTQHRCINPVTGKVLGPVPVASVLRPLVIGGNLHVLITTKFTF